MSSNKKGTKKEKSNYKDEGKYCFGEKAKNRDKKEQQVLEAPVRVDVEGIEDPLFDELQGLIGESILIITESDQLNLFGQAFRPIFCGTIFSVEQGNITLFPVTIKMVTAPFFQFPTPLSIPLEKIAQFTPNFDCDARIPLT
ncbi:hypothetical protein [Priestia filamentosa]|uniref:hypothetical protein n=1 Tax=Priestia filamentosa TaxID=1402861 RepID=UPI0002FE2EA5|nr:hypothetical protein [Priestia filamentosa]